MKLPNERDSNMLQLVHWLGARTELEFFLEKVIRPAL